jgi:hypothetical protein
VSRVRIHEAGLPAPVPQREIYGPDGRLVARVDFCWDEQRTVGEFDGRANTDGCSSLGSRSKRCFSKRSGVKTHFVILAGRSSGGYGPNSTVRVSSGIGF